MGKIRQLYVFFFLIATIGNIQGQDIQLSQFYATSLYQNPAFAGGAHFDRAIAHQRLQWMRLDAKYNTSLVSYDKYFSQYQSGVGLYLLRDVQGQRNINTMHAALQYAYELHINKDYAIRMGLQGEFVRRTTDYSVHTFPSQYDENNQDFTGTAPTFGSGSENRTYLDLGSGLLFYSDNLWIGATAHHLNTPNQSFLGGDASLPLKTAFTAGYRFSIKKDGDLIFRDHPTDYVIMPTVHYKSQGKNDQFDLGVYGIYDHLLFGFWYRGIPIKKLENIQNNESIVLMFGWELKQLFDIRYSYDFTVSTLSQPTVRSGGSHELNIAVLLHKAFKNNSSQKMKRLPCPDHHIHY